MKQIEISYEELEQDFIKELGKLGSEGLYRRGILATSEGDHVTARRMHFISNGLTLYCYTIRGTRKCKQIMANPNVAVVAGFVQYEGVASVKGHPLDEENADFIKAFKENQPEKYEREKRIFQNPDLDWVVIKVEPKRIALRKLADPASGIEEGIYILNVAKREAYGAIDSGSEHSDPNGAPAYWE
ncbi:MAG: hypothetical protein JSW00_07185 [Thermoplasmata archaeon]|nr:MAG: hypothetical protein JSW00_07185 [Thermoplasmata archaeon]